MSFCYPFSCSDGINLGPCVTACQVLGAWQVNAAVYYTSGEEDLWCVDGSNCQPSCSEGCPPCAFPSYCGYLGMTTVAPSAWSWVFSPSSATCLANIGVGVVPSSSWSSYNAVWNCPTSGNCGSTPDKVGVYSVGGPPGKSSFGSVQGSESAIASRWFYQVNKSVTCFYADVAVPNAAADSDSGCTTPCSVTGSGTINSFTYGGYNWIDTGTPGSGGTSCGGCPMDVYRVIAFPCGSGCEQGGCCASSAADLVANIENYGTCFVSGCFDPDP